MAPSAAHVGEVKAEAAAVAARIRQHPPTKSQVDARRFQLFEHLLAYMNGRGERPVIVFNPLYPTVYAALAHYGSPVTTSSIDYLRSLRAKYDFVVVNGEDIRTWGGTASDWKNASHIDQLNMRSLLRYVLTHSDGAGTPDERTPTETARPTRNASRPFRDR